MTSPLAAARTLGWRWQLALASSSTAFAFALRPTPGTLAVAAAAVVAAAVLLWAPRLIATLIAWLLSTTFLIQVGLWYASDTGLVPSPIEIAFYVATAQTLVAVLAHRLPGRPWFRLLSAATAPTAVALLLPSAGAAGLYLCYLLMAAGALAPSTIGPARSALTHFRARVPRRARGHA